MDSRYDLIKQSMAKAQEAAEQKRSERMAKRMTSEEREKAKDEVAQLFKEEDYSDEKAAKVLYEKHAIELSAFSVGQLRREMKLKQRRGKSGKPGKRSTKTREVETPAATRGGSGGSFEELMQAFEDFKLLLEEYREKRKEILESL